MKKGLRRLPDASLPQRVRPALRPDEEGIKTNADAEVARPLGVRP